MDSNEPLPSLPVLAALPAPDNADALEADATAVIARASAAVAMPVLPDGAPDWPLLLEREGVGDGIGAQLPRIMLQAGAPVALDRMMRTMLDPKHPSEGRKAADTWLAHALPRAASGAMRVRVEMSTHMLSVDVVRVDAP